MAHSLSGMRASGIPTLCTISKVAFANNSAFGFASPISSPANMTRRRAINRTSSPPASIRASQYTAASGSLPRMLLINAEIMS